MATRLAGIALTCVVATLMVAAPFATGSVTITRGDHGPVANAVTWELIAPDHGIWSMDIMNHGLQSLVVQVYDNTTGVPQEILHQRIKFVLIDAYPTGFTITDEVIMETGRIYSITATPYGGRGTYCEIQDYFWPTYPVAIMTVHWDYLNVTCSASDSYHVEGGSIVDYEWSFGDGAHASGIVVNHTYASAGIYCIILTVTDNIGLTARSTVYLHLTDTPW